MHKIAVVISARNESAVIGQLIESIHAQTYPAELIRIYVCADNCTDDTAEVARAAGATVFERQNRNLVGKGYALDYMFKKILSSDDDSDAFIVFDADNLIDREYITEMNKTFGLGFEAITSYRNSKNYGTNWISAGYSLWFLREAKYLNNARLELNTSCAISGTGFLLSRKLVEENGGWKHHLLTEDVEFSVDSVIQGKKIGYCSTAMLYDEQPITFRQSWRQRMRWAKGFYQVLGKYGLKLVKGTFLKLSFGCFDLLMTIFPAIFITLLSVICNVSRFIHSIFVARDGHEVLMVGHLAAGLYRDGIRLPAGRRPDHHADRVGQHPHHDGQEDSVCVHVPAVYAHLYPHRHRRDFPQGGVGAHRAYRHDNY